MSGWLLDRSVLIELRKSRPNPRVKSWSDAQPVDSLFLCTATIAEIRDYARHRRDSQLKTEVGIWLERQLRPWFADRILPLTEDIVLEWRRIVKRQNRISIGLRRPDLFVVATARVHDLTVCARNSEGYRAAGASAFSPWRAMTPMHSSPSSPPV